MAKDDTFVLRGRLKTKPRSGFSYFGTRKELVKILKEAKLGEDCIFRRIGNVKIEEDKVDIPVKIESAVLSALDNDWAREDKLNEIGLVLEKHFGIGGGMADTIEEKEGTKSRLREMESRGVIPIAYWTELEEKDFEEK